MFSCRLNLRQRNGIHEYRLSDPVRSDCRNPPHASSRLCQSGDEPKAPRRRLRRVPALNAGGVPGASGRVAGGIRASPTAAKEASSGGPKAAFGARPVAVVRDDFNWVENRQSDLALPHFKRGGKLPTSSRTRVKVLPVRRRHGVRELPALGKTGPRRLIGEWTQGSRRAVGRTNRDESQ